jgi:hypothetical protein
MKTREKIVQNHKKARKNEREIMLVQRKRKRWDFKTCRAHVRPCHLTI